MIWQALRTYQGHQRAVRGVTALGEYLYTASEDGTILIWDLTTGDKVGILNGHRDWVTCVHACPLTGESLKPE